MTMTIRRSSSWEISYALPYLARFHIPERAVEKVSKRCSSFRNEMVVDLGCRVLNTSFIFGYFSFRKLRAGVVNGITFSTTCFTFLSFLQSSRKKQSTSWRVSGLERIPLVYLLQA